MSYGIRFKAWGDFACFTRPEMKVERVSYDVMTPSAARGLIEAIYWKPAIRWVIDRVTVLNPIRFQNIRRNELGQKMSMASVNRAMRDGRSPVEILIEDARQQRAALVLRNVAYIVDAHFEFTSREDNNEGKHLDIIKRRLERGQCFHRPYFGCREFPACFGPDDGSRPHPELAGVKELGFMLHDLDYAKDMRPRFFRASLVDGVLDVPSFEEALA